MAKRGAGSSAAESMFGLPTAASTPAAARLARKAPTASASTVDDELKSLVGLVGRLALAASNKADHALAINTDVLLIRRSAVTVPDPTGAEKNLADMTRDAGKNFHDAIQGMAKEDRAKMGPPSLRTWEALVQWAVWAAQQKQVDSLTSAAKAYNDELAVYKQQGTKEMIEWAAAGVRFAKLGRTYEREIVKLEVAIPATEEHKNARTLWVEIIRLLCSQYGSQRKSGAPPPNAVHRSVVKAMKSMSMLEERTDRFD
eukprot:TRINITY_DN51957_c0_g1_i2.p2 TRINITY_DN51957_c0_g1~~TRINITY_DN51957_c0_g1_i2.p2  ORF type:complete len:257 (-),score=68.43 TRINITY_DN51957_c0_g1_i2:367-1137(-)